jgi:heme exporter protein C
MEERIILSARVIGPVALLAVLVWLVMVILVAPVEAVQGVVQKIFYVHVPCAPPAYLGFITAAIGGIGYLRTRQDHWDRLALSGAEVGVVFCTLIVVTGPIWAKPVWGHWWVWDLRLTSTLMLWFIYVGYLFLRGFAFGSDSARTFASIYGIAGTILIPFVYFAVDLARGSSLHPGSPVREGLPPEMLWTLLSGIAAFILIFAYLVARRLEVAHLEARAFERALEGAES